MKFVLLSQAYLDSALFVDPYSVKAIWAHADAENSYLSLGDGLSFTIKGKVKDIVRLLEEAQVTNEVLR